VSDLSRYAREAAPCKNCGQLVFYSAPDAVFLHVRASSGNNYYCTPGDIGGPAANPVRFPCHYCGGERCNAPGEECWRCRDARRAAANTPEAIRAAIMWDVD
jgi:hypothetical protein